MPIVTYHSIANQHDHLLRELSLPVDVFERQLRFLRDRGFQSVTLHDVHEYLKHDTTLPRKSVALTFDDGYLDNWVFAYPLLKKYGMKATVFVATDFVDPREICRPNLDDVWSGNASSDDIEWWGHLSWTELERMQESGVMNVQSHTRTHTWYFSDDRIADFHHPDDDYMWLHWNERPELKPYWLNDDFRKSVPWGSPVYDCSQTLLKPRYFEDPELSRSLTDYVSIQGGRAFFERDDWKEQLHRVAAEHRASHELRGRFETDDEYHDRVLDEMIGSKRIIEDRLNKPVDFLCWPCGDYTDRLQRLAIESCGYRATVNCAKTTNKPGDDPSELRRIDFGQQYQGPCSHQLVFLRFLGLVSFESGDSMAYPVAPISWRLMKIGDFLQDSWRSVNRHFVRRSPPERPAPSAYPETPGLGTGRGETD